MILRWVRLENIRSYVNARVDFPKGSILLSGDIGSGKSTILYALEFALFGIMRSNFSGEALLRHGCNEGSVELCFNIDNKEIIIKRYLKRTMGSVGQQAGYIVFDGVRYDGTPIELKSKILSFLGYPESLLTKSKSLIFRYTVYTPQEDMKRILFEESEERLDTLRKIFGIDKYKAISNNVSIFTKYLRDRKRELSGTFIDIDAKLSQKNEFSLSIAKLEISLDDIDQKLSEIVFKLKEKISHINEKQEDMKKLIELKSEYSSIKSFIDENERSLKSSELQKSELIDSIALLRSKLANLNQNIDISSIKEEIRVLESSLTEKQRISAEIKERLRNLIETIAKEQQEINKGVQYFSLIAQNQKEYDMLLVNFIPIPDIQSALVKNNHELLAISNNEKEFDVKIEQSAFLKDKILCIENCPTCLQPVSADHKHAIAQAEESKLAEFTIRKKEYSSIKEKLISENDNLNKRLSSASFDHEKMLKLKADIESKKKELDNFSKREEHVKMLEQEKSQVLLRLHSSDLLDIERLKETIDNKKIILEKASMNKVFADQIFDKNAQLKRVEDNIVLVSGKLEDLNAKKSIIYSKYELLKDSHDEYKKLREEHDVLKERENNANVQKATIQKEIEGLSARINSLDNEINKKILSRSKYEKLVRTENWLNEFFLKLMSTMERQVMYRIYHEFNSYFVSWFNMLIDDELLNARIGADFSPIISQNGYETSLENLSGGEKTAVALAYRLSLNKVINDLVNTIKTSDIIILDEPTDGFSSEQLDKVREVLIELGVKQTIIVSHESKIESFVENVIRISKKEHESEVG